MYREFSIEEGSFAVTEKYLLLLDPFITKNLELYRYSQHYNIILDPGEKEYYKIDIPAYREIIAYAPLASNVPPLKNLLLLPEVPVQEEELLKKIVKILEDADVRKHTCINGSGYSQVERNLANLLKDKNKTIIGFNCQVEFLSISNKQGFNMEHGIDYDTVLKVDKNRLVGEYVYV